MTRCDVPLGTGSLHTPSGGMSCRSLWVLVHCSEGYVDGDRDNRKPAEILTAVADNDQLLLNVDASLVELHCVSS